MGENIQFRNTDESISSLHIVWFSTSSHFSQRILPSRADNRSPLLRFWVWYLSDVAGAFGVQRHRTRGTTCILCLGNPEHISHYKHWLSTTAIWCFLFSFFFSLISFTLRWKRDGSLEALPTTYLKALMSWHTFSQVWVSSLYLKLQLFSRQQQTSPVRAALQCLSSPPHPYPQHLCNLEYFYLTSAGASCAQQTKLSCHRHSFQLHLGKKKINLVFKWKIQVKFQTRDLDS